MKTAAKTVRLPFALSDRLRRSAFRTGKPQNELIINAVEHWLTHPYRPGCPNAEAAHRYYEIAESEHSTAATP